MEYLWLREADYLIEYPLSEASRLLSFRREEHIPFRWFSLPDGREAIFGEKEGKRYSIGEELWVGNGRCCDIRLELSNNFMLKGGRLLLEREEEALFLNGRKLRGIDWEREGRARGELFFSLHEGDELFLEDTLFLFEGADLMICCPEERIETERLPLPKREKTGEDFPNYKRSPRLIKELPRDPIEIQKLPERASPPRGGLFSLLLPPLLMLLVSAAICVLFRRGAYIFMSLSMTLVTAGLSVSRYFSGRRECREKNEKSRELYERYLLDCRKRIYLAYQKNLEVLRWNNPSLKAIERMVREYNSRIYERSITEEDFLSVCIGCCEAPTDFPIRLKLDPLRGDPEALERKAEEIQREFSMILHKPLVLNLGKLRLGVIGERKYICEQLKILAAKLCFFHSYHELRLVPVFSEEEDADFSWMRWFPHCRIPEMNILSFVESGRGKEQVLGGLTEIFRERAGKRKEKRRDFRFLPHYLFLLAEPKLILDHPIMEYLSRPGEELGFSLIYTARSGGRLPEYIDTVYEIEDSGHAKLILKEGREQKLPFELERVGEIELPWIARNLSVLSHEQRMVSHIPESIRFFELFHVREASELPIEENWRKNLARKTLAVPIGAQTKQDIEYLNLHEKADGPHGLIAGTTGSGKSELLQTYILSLAVHFHPYEISFLLIDYKGGGMAGVFRDLPHLLGVITNLDGSESMRALASIRSELSRRQRLFQDFHVNHIHDYHRLFQLGEAAEPVPELFLISDEFAELKKEQPEFMKELVSAARIGRSLGVHLILATQQPAGVVDEQIWTNSNFKIALKLQNESDSREILKTADAAGITRAGRAYLKVGNNERYELFQSAWSGAPVRSFLGKKDGDERVYRVNALGQGELLNQDLSDLSSSQGQAVSDRTELELTVERLKELSSTLSIRPVRRPWLPPLPPMLVSPLMEELCEGESGSSSGSRENRKISDLCFPIGLLDIPEEQLQKVYRPDLQKDGGILYFASAGFGKTSLLMTAALSLAWKNPVELLHFYVLDFGNSGLVMLDALPHTADYIRYDDGEKLLKFQKRLMEELRRRKRLFAGNAAQNFRVYQELSSERLPAVVILVDPFDAVRELGPELEDFFVRITRDGPGLGIFPIFSATRSAAVKYAILNNFKLKIAGFLHDEHEAAGIVGRCGYPLTETRGRAYVKLTDVHLMQLYLICPFSDEIGYNAGVRERIREIERKNPGKRAPRLVVLPEELSLEQFRNYRREEDSCEIPIGLDVESVRAEGMGRMDSPFLVLGEAGRGKTTVLFSMIDQLLLYQRESDIALFDSKSLLLLPYRGRVRYIESEEEALDLVDDVTELCTRRKSALEAALSKGEVKTPREFYENQRGCWLFIDDADDFMEKWKTQLLELFQMLVLASESGVGVVISIHAGKFRARNEFTAWLRSSSNGLLLGNPGAVGIFQPASSREYTSKGYGLLFRQGSYRKLLLPGAKLL